MAVAAVVSCGAIFFSILALLPPSLPPFVHSFLRSSVLSPPGETAYQFLRDLCPAPLCPAPLRSILSRVYVVSEQRWEMAKCNIHRKMAPLPLLLLLPSFPPLCFLHSTCCRSVRSKSSLTPPAPSVARGASCCSPPPSPSWKWRADLLTPLFYISCHLPPFLFPSIPPMPQRPRALSVPPSLPHPKPRVSVGDKPIASPGKGEREQRVIRFFEGRRQTVLSLFALDDHRDARPALVSWLLLVVLVHSPSPFTLST